MRGGKQNVYLLHHLEWNYSAFVFKKKQWQNKPVVKMVSFCGREQGRGDMDGS